MIIAFLFGSGCRVILNDFKLKSLSHFIINLNIFVVIPNIFVQLVHQQLA